MAFKDIFSLRKHGIFWLNILAMCLFVLLVLVGVFMWLGTYTHHGEAVTVPELKGVSLTEATRQLQALDLTCQVADSDYVKTMPAGCILEHTPYAGQKVKRGRVVFMTINTLSVPTVSVPDVADNSSLRQAEARLLAAGFKISEVEYVEGERDWVYGVKYNGRLLLVGEKVPDGSVLSLQVGGGEDFNPDSLNIEGLTDPQIGEAATKVVKPKQETTTDDDSWF